MDVDPFLRKLEIAGARFTMSTPGHIVYVVPSRFLLDQSIDETIKTWDNNRPPDQSRVAALRKHMAETHRCPGVICLAILRGKVVCYDGNHRRLALTDDVHHVLLDVMIDATDACVWKEFENVNKSVPVPVIYTSTKEQDKLIKDKIETKVKWYDTKYKAHKSASARPQKPNYNRDKLIDNFTYLYKLFKDQGSIDVLFQNVEKLNDSYGRGEIAPKTGKGKSDDMIKKCETTGLWLFLHGSEINRYHLEIVYQDKY